jgi:hypothetical protein
MCIAGPAETSRGPARARRRSSATHPPALPFRYFFASAGPSARTPAARRDREVSARQRFPHVGTPSDSSIRFRTSSTRMSS